MTAAPTDPSARPQLALRLLLILLLMAFVLFSYTCLHEGGHALVGLLLGGKLTSFSVRFWDISAHAGIFGEFTDAQRALIAVAGISLPLLAWLVLLLWTPAAAPPRRQNPVLDLLRALAVVMTLNTLLAWIILPVLSLFGVAASDDSLNFLRLTGMPPLLLSLAALAVYLGGWWLFFRRSGSPREVLIRLRQPAAEFSSPASRRTLLALGAVTLALLAGVLSLDAALARQHAAGLQPDVPAGYALVAVLPLDPSAADLDYAYPFHLDSPASPGFIIILEDIPRGPVEVLLRGPQGEVTVFMRAGPDFSTGRSTIAPRDLALQPGDYTLILRAPAGKGRISLYQSGLE